MVSAIKQNFDKRYDIMDIVGEGGMGLVYSAYDRLTGDMVALKKVKPDFQPVIEETGSSIANFRVALAQEFSVLATLRHPNIISVLDYGFDTEKNPFFTMSLLNQPQTIVEYAKNRSVAEKIELILQMMEAIDYLHRRGIIHRDLKPENVIIDDGQVKVLDFGVARLQYQQQNEPKDMMVGTLAFMAPETFEANYNDNLARLSDIYAAGVVAYETLTGVFPYDTTNVSILVRQIATHIPDIDLIVDLETDLNTDRVSAVVARMLEKSPLDRYLSTTAVLDAFHAVLGRQRETNIEVRESLLQTARMVGRESELKQLDASLKLTFAEQGSLWLIGGETGVGKSRLADELRIRALVRGALVVRGQSVAEASAPYHLWRDVLSRIILEVNLEPLEASVIKPIVPNIANLLGVDDVPEAPEIGAVASYNRLVTVIIDIFKRINREVLIILEDLHWTREGLNLLKQLIPLTINNPLMIVGTYRIDDRPNLPQELAGCQTMTLQNLSPSAVSAYTESVVGNDAGLPAIIELLQAETDGNVLFVMEFLRALIEEFRLIENFNADKVPQTMCGAGVRGVIHYRLSKLPEKYRRMLQFAAVPGRVIDVDVMKKIYGEETVADWLEVGEEAMFLRVRNDRWRISNDTIRNALLDGIEPGQLLEYHRQTAETIEQLYDEEIAAVRLSYHWAEAGNVTKEAYYKAIAAENAYDGSAFLEASEYFGRWLELYEQGQIQAEKLTVARFRRRIGECYLEIGKISESLNAFISAVETLRPDVPRGQLSRGMAMMVEVFRQTWHRFSPFDMVTKSKEKRDIIEEVAVAMNQIAEVTLSYQPDPILSVYASLRVLNISELIGAGYSLAFATSGVALLVASIGQHGLARTYLKLANEMLENGLEKTAIAAMTFPMSIVYTGWGEWDTANKLLNQCLINSDDVGDWRSWRQAYALGGDIDHYRGDYESANNKYVKAYDLTARMNHASQMAIQLAIRSRTLFMMGRYRDAVSIADNALALDDAPMASLNALPVHVLNALRLQEWGTLQKYLDAMSEKIANNPVKIYVQFDGYSALAEAQIALLAKQSNDKNRQLAQSACKELTGFSKTYPIAQARAKIFEARRLFLTSEPGKASTLAQEGLQIAETMQMPYEIGLAHMVLGRINSDDSHTQKARDIFGSIQSEWGLHQLEHFDI